MWGLARHLKRTERRATEPVRTGPAAEVEIAGDAPPSAAIAARISRSEKLKPEDDRLESFVSWVARHGGSIDDTDELLAQYTWMCRAAGWDKAAPDEIAPEPEPAPVAETPSSPAKRDKKQKAPKGRPVVKAPPADKAPAVREIPPAPAKTTLEAKDAAERFVEWIQMTGRTGTYSSAEMTDLYRSHCRAEDLVEVPENMMRSALAQIGEAGGVKKHTIDNGTSRGRKRHRPCRWTIAKAATVADDIPWSDLPRRKAA